jgi:hypothetical protein
MIRRNIRSNLQEARVRLNLRLDPRPLDYDPSVQIDERLAPPAVALDVETAEWAPRAPEPVPRPGTVAFVDGAQHIEARVLADDGERLVYGAFASYAVGAAICEQGRVTTRLGAPRRALTLSDGAREDDVELVCGGLRLRYVAAPSSEAGAEAPARELHRLRQDAERDLGHELTEEGVPLVIADGPLRFQRRPKGHVVGVVKTMHTLYVDLPKLGCLAGLRPGERSPVFLIERDRPAYSWFVRLADGGPSDHALSGIVRIETMADGVSLEETIELADLTAGLLPCFAGPPYWDARAPQNLVPIAGLERQLRRTLGDAAFVRRAIETYLMKEVRA